MKLRLRQEFSYTGVWGAALLLLLLLTLGGCARHEPASGAVTSDVDYYTCTMHPSVHSKTPGKCPICSMDLVPVKKQDAPPLQQQQQQQQTKTGAPAAGTTALAQPTEFTVPVERQQQIGVTYAAVEKRPLRFSIRSVGFLEAETGKSFDYVARVDGYVQDLKVRSPGERVTKGQPLMTVYSPDLRSTEQELANLLNDRDRSGAGRPSPEPLIDAARQRLKLWNVSEQEIAGLEQTRKASTQLTLRSPFDGVVGEVGARPGMGVKVGDRLASVLDLSELWLWAEFYENEVDLLQEGQAITVTLPALPNRAFEGRIAVISPALDLAKRTARVRIDVPNPAQRLRPGMYANVEVQVDGGQGLTIPASAALPTGSRALVFLDKGEGKLQPQYVRVGRSFAALDGAREESFYEVLEGLSEGQRVVASANFLIDAESKVQGALKDWQGGEERPGATPEGAQTPAAKAAGPASAASIGPLLDVYGRLRKALAQDAFEQVPALTVGLRKSVGALGSGPATAGPPQPAYSAAVRTLEASSARFTPANLEQARVEFGQFSAEFLAFLKTFAPGLPQPLYAMQCPRWKKSPAVWLQDSPQVDNPYMGPAMATCGVVQETFRAER
jgi:Cu(I)/Ag(I) efflux system membrane fusion protein